MNYKHTYEISPDYPAHYRSIEQLVRDDTEHNDRFGSELLITTLNDDDWLDQVEQYAADINGWSRTIAFLCDEDSESSYGGTIHSSVRFACVVADLFSIEPLHINPDYVNTIVPTHETFTSRELLMWDSQALLLEQSAITELLHRHIYKIVDPTAPELSRAKVLAAMSFAITIACIEYDRLRTIDAVNEAKMLEELL